MGLQLQLYGDNPEPHMSALGQKQTFWPISRHVRFTPKSGHRSARLQCPLWADFVVEVGLEGRVGWADDFLRSRQGQRFAPAPAIGEVPEQLRKRTLAVRGFDASGMMTSWEIVEGSNVEAAI